MEWISIDDNKKPEQKQRVLCYCKSRGDYEGEESYDICRYRDGRFLLEEVYDDVDYTDIVDYWSLLPPPPQDA